MLGANVFAYRKNDYERGQVFVGDPNGEPFIVRAETKGWLPVNVLIYAASEEDAVKRVKEGLSKAYEMEQVDDFGHKERYKLALELFDHGKVTVEPFDKTYTCKISWDSRGL